MCSRVVRDRNSQAIALRLARNTQDAFTGERVGTIDSHMTMFRLSFRRQNSERRGGELTNAAV
jgi:hypothetical protein